MFITYFTFNALFFYKKEQNMEEKTLSLQQEAEIKEKAQALKTENKLRKIYPMVVFGDATIGEKEFYDGM